MLCSVILRVEIHHDTSLSPQTHLLAPPGSFTLNGGNSSWKIYDNVFDKVFRNVVNSPIASSRNAYIGLEQQHKNPLATDVLYLQFAPLPYGNGPLGRFYSPAQLRDQGSRNANAAGLYHFTTDLPPIPGT